MNTDRWIAIAAVAATLLTGFFGPMLSARYSHYLQTRKPKLKRAEESSDQPVAQSEAIYQRVRARWVVRIGLALIQATAIILLFRLMHSSEPLTRVSMLMISIYISIVGLCFALTWIVGIYENMEAMYGYIYATADAVRYDMGMQEKRTQQALRNGRA